MFQTFDEKFYLAIEDWRSDKSNIQREWQTDLLPLWKILKILLALFVETITTYASMFYLLAILSFEFKNVEKIIHFYDNNS